MLESILRDQIPSRHKRLSLFNSYLTDNFLQEFLPKLLDNPKHRSSYCASVQTLAGQNHTISEQRCVDAAIFSLLRSYDALSNAIKDHK